MTKVLMGTLKIYKDTNVKEKQNSYFAEWEIEDACTPEAEGAIDYLGTHGVDTEIEFFFENVWNGEN